MKVLNIITKILFLLMLFLFPIGCVNITNDDPCYRTKWSLPKEFEIKLAVHISSSNQMLPGSTVDSQYPADFQSLLVNGTIEMIECSGETDGLHSLGNTYISKDVDYPAPIDIPKSYWFGHVVYVYKFDNDDDQINLDLNLKVTMKDGQSYTCTYSDEIFYEQIIQVPGEMYHYILLDVYSNLWVKV